MRLTLNDSFYKYGNRISRIVGDLSRADSQLYQSLFGETKHLEFRAFLSRCGWLEIQGVSQEVKGGKTLVKTRKKQIATALAIGQVTLTSLGQTSV